mmetsp:Transcript_29175/g.61944  ORF Transcript_29175/g.61944 Transcript_29175/m.61944 type:complete len:146 (+) Transcript_29175:840-1277(+)
MATECTTKHKMKGRMKIKFDFNLKVETSLESRPETPSTNAQMLRGAFLLASCYKMNGAPPKLGKTPKAVFSMRLVEDHFLKEILVEARLICALSKLIERMGGRLNGCLGEHFAQMLYPSSTGIDSGPTHTGRCVMCMFVIWHFPT